MTKLNRRIAIIAAAASVCAGSTGALALTATQNFTVTVKVDQTCTITTGRGGSTLDFGTYNPTNTSTASANVLSVTCTNGGTTAQVTLNGGGNPTTGATPERQMADTSGTHLLIYKLFYDAAMTHEWTATSGPTLIEDGTAHDLTVYGSIASGQSVFVTTYSDQVTATVTF